MATWMGLEPTITGETVQRISHYATKPNMRVSSLIRSQLTGGQDGSRTHSPIRNGFTVRHDSPTSPPAHII